ncbi:protein of unknown function DUF1571 [Solidesulfovibrio carbinoliphilus subsp. oakridgensis]|uniref:Outer membrane lipoprotein carrier protein LolA n=1 Tax=Solidesulfovibrio carbinoliphilus subsp. oakridgensis TaxID=694327 RepID=G7Q6L3_9BACT|nr:DUF1571 domain-containing protein [Solidesulfovibrio carbinoliphilus]EHJ47626.1 protein of unknown function DUF1571 [Solidesulfovibrio carbinoliphilus subsp. oakridgensis]
MPENMKYPRFQEASLPLPTFFPRRGRFGRSVWLVTALALLWLAAFQSPALASDPKQELMDLLGRMESSYAKIVDYCAIFQKKERVKKVLLPEEFITLKFRKPLQVYMKWLHGPTKEAIYVDGANSNKVVAHSDGAGAGLTWNLDPKGSVLRADNRHVITDIGFGFIIQMMRENIPTAIRHSELGVSDLADTVFEGRPSTVFEVTFSPKEGRTYYASRIVCHVDKEFLMPIGITCYDEKGDLVEQYRYKDVKINVGLTDQDFSRKNPAYKF